MANSWGNVDTDMQVDKNSLPNLPECKVTATTDPAGLIRFDVAEEYADSLLEQIGLTLDSHDDDSLVDIQFLMDRPAYLSLTNGLEQLLSADGVAVKQVLPQQTQPDISVVVAVSESQLETALTTNRQAATLIGPRDMCGHEFSVSENGARMLCTQLAAALHGHDKLFEVIQDA